MVALIDTDVLIDALVRREPLIKKQGKFWKNATKIL